MIFFDITKAASIRHRSGLARLSERLREELGLAACAAAWEECRTRAGASDWFVTTELFSERERPGFLDWIRTSACRTAAVFADAIPLKHPHITWPQSVARHPGYMKSLAAFSRVWAISAASRDELVGYWRWLGLANTPPVDILPLGADLGRTPRVTTRQPSLPRPSLLSVGILEPRKNQLLTLAACEQLWGEGLAFELHLVGRVNPHFGAPVAARIKALQKRYASLHYHATAPDKTLLSLYAAARATVCPTLAEGCGLPLLESLWHGVPCVCSDLPVLRENADGGGCMPVPLNDLPAWVAALRRVLTDDPFHAELAAQACTRSLPTWREAAAVLAAVLK